MTVTLQLSACWLRANIVTIITCQNVSEICEWKQPSLCSYNSLLVRQERQTDVLLEPMKVIQEKNNSVSEEEGMCCFAFVFISSIKTFNQENNTSLWYTCKSCTHSTFRLTNYLSFWNFLLTQTGSQHQFNRKPYHVYVSPHFSITIFWNNCFNSLTNFSSQLFIWVLR